MPTVKKHGNSKYTPKYAKWLRNGLRKEGMFIAEVCAAWGITEETYLRWVEAHESFKLAHQISETHFKSFWGKGYRDTATGVIDGNGPMLQLAAKNYLGMVDKQEVHNTHEEKITTIQIRVLPSSKLPEPKIIDVEPTRNITDASTS